MFKKRSKNALKRSTTNREDEEEEGETSEKEVVQRSKAKRQKVAASTLEQDQILRKHINQELDSVQFEKAEKLHLDDDDVPVESTALDRAKEKQEISQAIQSGKLDPNVYRGEKNYATFFKQSEQQLKSKLYKGTLGPLAAPNFIRSTTRIDHNPEICRPYFETGYCAYGDSCIFIHDRTDYKSGHQLDVEYEKAKKRREKLI